MNTSKAERQLPGRSRWAPTCQTCHTAAAVLAVSATCVSENANVIRHHRPPWDRATGTFTSCRTQVTVA